MATGRGKPALPDCVNKLRDVLEKLYSLTRICGTDVNCYRMHGVPPHPFFRGSGSNCYQLLRRMNNSAYTTILYSMRLDPLGLTTCLFRGREPPGWLPLLRFHTGGGRVYTLAASRRDGCIEALACGPMMPGATPAPEIELSLHTAHLAAALRATLRNAKIAVQRILWSFYAQATTVGKVLGNHVPLSARSIIYRMPTALPSSGNNAIKPFPQLVILECNDGRRLGEAYVRVARGTVESLLEILGWYRTPQSYYIVRYALLDSERGLLLLSGIVWGQKLTIDLERIGCEIRIVELTRTTAPEPLAARACIAANTAHTYSYTRAYH